MSERRIRVENRYWVRRPQAEPEHESRLMLALVVIGEVLTMALLLLVLLFGVPFVIWLVAS